MHTHSPTDAACFNDSIGLTQLSPDNPLQGILAICKGGKWRIVESCDGLWQQASAISVTCRQLGPTPKGMLYRSGNCCVWHVYQCILIFVATCITKCDYNYDVAYFFQVLSTNLTEDNPVQVIQPLCAGTEDRLVDCTNIGHILGPLSNCSTEPVVVDCQGLL